MRLVRYHADDGPRAGVLDGTDVVDFSATLDVPDATVGPIDMAMDSGLSATALEGTRVALSFSNQRARWVARFEARGGG
ncbi:MAG: Rv2993c-like domain-containing protein [Acidimicrobiia bacterium]